MDDSRYSVFRGRHLVEICDDLLQVFDAAGTEVRLIATATLARPVSWADVAADVACVVGRDVGNELTWLFTPEGQFLELARRHASRDFAGCGFVRTKGGPLVAIARSGELRLMDLELHVVATANLSRPHSYTVHDFVQLPAGRLALVGSMFSDPLDMIITVHVDDLVSAPPSVQTAIAKAPPIHDRAERLIVGPAPGDCAVVMRNPGDEEPIEDDDEDTPDVWGLHGYYIKSLVSGGLIERRRWPAMFDKSGTIVATEQLVAMQVGTTVNFIDRVSGRTAMLADAALDPLNARVATIEHGRWTIRKVDSMA